MIQINLIGISPEDVTSLDYFLQATCVRGPAGPDLAIYCTVADLKLAFEGLFSQSLPEGWLEELVTKHGLQVGEPDPHGPHEGSTVRGVDLIPYWRTHVTEKKLERLGLRYLHLAAA